MWNFFKPKSKKWKVIVMDAPQENSTLGNIGNEVTAAVESVANVIEHPIAAIENEAQKIEQAVKVELEDLSEKVKTFFHTTSPGHLQEALLAIVDRLVEVEKTVASLKDFVRG